MSRGGAYPRLGASGALARPKGSLPPERCECCDDPATQYVYMQVSWFRGEDDVYKTCKRHAQLAGRDPNRFCHLARDLDRTRRAAVIKPEL